MKEGVGVAWCSHRATFNFLKKKEVKIKKWVERTRLKEMGERIGLQGFF